MREIKLNETCKGTWCGGKRGAENKFVFAFREGRSYSLVFEAKKEKYDLIKWSFGPVDPEWQPMSVSYLYDVCRKEVEVYNTTLDNYTYSCVANVSGVGGVCGKLNCKIAESCNASNKPYIAEKNRTVKNCNRYLKLDNSTVDFGLQGYNCVETKGMIVCDSKVDGNGDGVCDPNGGETCCKVEDDHLVCKNSVVTWQPSTVHVNELKKELLK